MKQRCHNCGMVDGPIRKKCGISMQIGNRDAGDPIRSMSKPEVDFWYGDRKYSLQNSLSPVLSAKPEIDISQPWIGLLYLHKIWHSYINTFDQNNIVNFVNGNWLVTSVAAIFEAEMTRHNYAVDGSIRMKFDISMQVGILLTIWGRSWNRK